MKNILTSWIGLTDLKASNGIPDVGMGPIAQAVTSRAYDEVCLISDLKKEEAESYVGWISKKTKAPIKLYPEPLSGPTVFSEIYQSVVRSVEDIRKRHGQDTNLTFHISPGTPQMAAVWIILSKTRFPAEIIESSLIYGVQTTSVPFDISADFLPDLLRNPDRNLEKMAAGMPKDAPEFEDIVYRSQEMENVVLRARRIAPRSIPVLIEGESGTGKELFARAIHKASPRQGEFICINCGAIPKDLAESEFFGYNKGAFTGAEKKKIGHFEAAHEGTIFLDEIGELSEDIQVKLLRTIQESEVKPIGSNNPVKINVRIIAATNRNLIDEVAQGRFREDLFYRLAVGVIKLPALRERSGDISFLVDRFLRQINTDSKNEPGYKNKKISASAKNLLIQHPWPGNVRELQNTLIRAAVWSVDDEINDNDIREAIFPIVTDSKGRDGILNQSLETGVDLPQIMKKVAVHYLKRGLEKKHGNKTKAAKILGLSSYQTLTNWLKKYDLE